MARRVLTWTGVVLVAALAASLNFYQLPLAVWTPGPVEDALPQVKLAGARVYEPSGSLFLTTVAQDDRVTFYEALLNFADRDVQVVPLNSVRPAGQTEEETDLDNRAQMESSKLAATVVGLRRAGLNVKRVGVRIFDVVPGSAAEEAGLQADDRVLAVGGTRVASADDVRRQVVQASVGKPLEFQIQRGTRTLEIEAVPRAKRDPEQANAVYPYVGVVALDVFDLPVDVDITTENIGGPSAGLIFALSIVEKLGPDDLTRGRKIAGTGTIDYDGNVGPIGGIEQKLIAAKRMGATAFLCPRANYEEARRAVPRGVELVPVSTIDEALEWLRGGDTAAAPTP